MQPRGSSLGWGNTPRGCALAASSSPFLSGELAIMVSSTRFRRARARSGLTYGLSPEVDCTMPANNAACCQFRSFASTPK
ncbi:Uncharacterised protein [Mycobacteroides abscessus subsp. abscessus]|nr:Uncharacterised protein [Mycobacteroides abscessus subsp. abscessus]